jgi:signal transduction histidine kinase
MERQESREPTLLRSWIFRSLLVALVAGTLLYFVVGAIAQRQEIGLASDLAARTSLHFFHELELRWLPSHPDSVVPRTDAEFAELERLFDLHRKSLRIPRIVWFDEQRRIVHCGTRELAGVPVSGDDELSQVTPEGRVERLLPAGTHMHLDGARFDVPLLEVYVAAPKDLHPRLRGHVVELYLDATDIVRRVEAFRRWTLLASLGFGAALFVAVLQLLRRAQRRLTEQNERLRALSAGLERDVESRTQELIRTRRLADVGTLAAGLAHEINNPLAIIGANAQGLLDRLRRDPGSLQRDRADFEEYLRAIEGETFRCKRITESLLSFSRARPAALRRVDLRALATEVVTLMRPLAAARHQSIVVASGDQPAPVDASPDELKQLLVNLLTNAFDAGSEGQQVEVRCRVADGRAIVEVRDRGRGLDAVGTEQIFEPFFTTKGPGDGVGMGLPVSRHIAELHGGRLVAEVPEDGVGARLRCELPLAQAAATPEEANR